MIALSILDLKKFMSAFLIGGLFDEYSLIEAQITTFCTFSIDGRLEKAFYQDRSEISGEEGAPLLPQEDAGTGAEYVAWKQVRPYCFEIIKGKKTPLFFKFVFFYPKEKIPAFLSSFGLSTPPEEIAGLCLNLRYDGNNLVLTTGTSMKVFTMDRSCDHAWDDAVRGLMARQSIRTEEV